MKQKEVSNKSVLRGLTVFSTLIIGDHIMNE